MRWKSKAWCVLSNLRKLYTPLPLLSKTPIYVILTVVSHPTHPMISYIVTNKDRMGHADTPYVAVPRGEHAPSTCRGWHGMGAIDWPTLTGNGTARFIRRATLIHIRQWNKWVGTAQSSASRSTQTWVCAILSVRTSIDSPPQITKKALYLCCGLQQALI